MSDLKINTSQSLQQGNLLFNQKVCTFTFEDFVSLLLNNYDNITCFHPGVLICFAVENILLVVRSTFVDLSFDDLLFLNNFFTIASLAFVFLINDFTFTTAIITRSLGLCVHAWPKHLHSDYLAASLASSALLDSAFFATLAFALATDSLAVYCNFGLLSTVNFFQS